MAKHFLLYVIFFLQIQINNANEANPKLQAFDCNSKMDDVSFDFFTLGSIRK